MKIIVDLKGLDSSNLGGLFAEISNQICEAIDEGRYDAADLFDENDDYVINAEDVKDIVRKTLATYCNKLVENSSEVIA